MTALPRWRRGRPRPVRSALPAEGRYREAVVFSGGGSLGAAQVGALRALFEAGVVPDLVVGCSVGALNAAFLAVSPTLQRVAELEDVWLRMHRRHVFPDGRLAVARRIVARREHLYSIRGVEHLVRAWLPLDDLADTAVPCHVVTTDLLAGRPAWWFTGDPVPVLTASAALPALFPPVHLDGSLHVDGAVTCPVPAQRALDLGAERVWCLDVSSEFHGWGDGRMTALDVLLESFAVTRSHLAHQAPAVAADQQLFRLPGLGIGRHDMRDFSRTTTLLAAGLFAGRRMVASAQRLAPVSPLPVARTPS